MIPGGGKSRPRIAPVIGAVCRPLETRRAHQALQRPRGVIRYIGNETKLAGMLQNAPQLFDHFVLNKSTLPMSSFRPRIRMNEIDPHQRRCREPFDQADRVTEM